MDTVTDSLTYDGLIVGDFGQVTQVATAADSQTLVRGTVLGVVTATGFLIPCDHTVGDGSEVPYGVLVEDITTGGSEAECLIYTFGMFDQDKLTFGGTSTPADLRDAMRDRNLYLKETTVL